MGKKIKWDEYNLRTLAFYQKQGGVYSDLITVLQKARTDRNVVTYIPKHTPARLLNMASYIAALVMEDKENSARLIDLEKQKLANLHKEDQCLIFSIVYILIGDLDIEGANQELMEYIGTSVIYQKLSAAIFTFIFLWTSIKLPKHLRKLVLYSFLPSFPSFFE